jgi:hypothetical protein
VDRPVSGVDGEEVDKMLVFHSSTMARSPAATLPFYSAYTKQIALQEKRTSKGLFTVYTMKRGNTVPKGLNISPMNNETINIQMYKCTNAWQPSLVLGGLGRALTGPYSPQGLYPRPKALQAY